MKITTPTKSHFIISVQEDGLRLDKALSLHVDVQSRSRAEFLIDHGFVKVNGRPQKPSHRLKIGDEIEFELPPEKSTSIVPLEGNLEILFEDEDLLVVDKPSGLVVHPGAGHEQDTLVNLLVHKVPNLSMGFGEHRPGVVHRIDKETSGLLVIAKNDFSHEFLSQQFQKKTIHRIYEAIVVGAPRISTGTIQSYLVRHPIHRKKFTSLRDRTRKIIRHQNPLIKQGKWAVTHYQLLATFQNMSLLQLRLETGRTHQIRVHLSEIGLPIVGDVLYGAHAHTIKGLAPARFLLHAKELGFYHPKSGKQLFFQTEWPAQERGEILCNF